MSATRKRRAGSARSVWLLATGLALAGCRAALPRAEAPGPFVFQNSLWVNLHHFLRGEARRAARKAEPILPLEALSAEERRAWSEGLAAYRDLAGRDLLRDQGMVELLCALAGAGEARALAPGRVSAELTRALNGAAPVYRRRAWPAHARANAEWIAATAPLVERFGAELVAALGAAYGIPWPAQPILVDPSFERGPVLAYTTRAAPPGYAGHVTIDPGEPNRGPVAFECLAHEASHVVDDVLTGWIEAESARQGIEPPPELWHALLFFTSGVVAERVLGSPGTYRRDVSEGYPAYHAALEQHWRPYLDGSAPLAPALRGLVRDAEGARRRSAGGE